MFFSCQNTSGHRLLSRPRLFTIPQTDKALPQQLKIKFITPSQPGRLYLKLHIMSELYTGTDFSQNFTLDVHERIRKFVKFTDGEPTRSRTGTTLKDFNASTKMSLSRTGVSQMAQLYRELKAVEKEEQRLTLAGKEKPAELVARREFLDRERQKWKNEKQAGKETCESQKKTAEEEKVAGESAGEEGKKEEVGGAESMENRKEKAFSRRIAIKRWGLTGLEALIPDTLDNANWLLGFRLDDEVDSPSPIL